MRFRDEHVSMLSLVWWTTSCGTMRAAGCGTWLGVCTSHPPPPSNCCFYSILVHRDVSEVPRNIVQATKLPRRIVTVALTPVQRVAGGTCTVGRVPTCAPGGQGCATCTILFLALSLVPSQWEYLILHRLLSN